MLVKPSHFYKRQTWLLVLVAILSALSITFLLFPNSRLLHLSEDGDSDNSFYGYLEHNQTKVIQNPFKKTSSKLLDLRKFYNERFNGTFVRPPKRIPKTLLSFRNDYLALIPLSRNEDPSWIKNLYSDLNFVSICDKNDTRELCDMYSPRLYSYYELTKKTFDMFNFFCKSGAHKQYKVILKMDFDLFIDKKYLYEVLDYMVKNNDRRIYFGDPMIVPGENGIAMNGKIYGVTSNIIDDYCSCSNPEPESGLEDLWFGYTIGNCIKGKKYSLKDGLLYYNSLEHFIFHKKYKWGNVNYSSGRKL
ncbi:hypothetical protein AYI68_g4901 [Smittium mucronatum]|uniref:Hexosyltransferase n=1 Tax=Smittium mucronatum TaxID=133383 RepID=A0A1R0GVR7_9FUNG|nr:hypothetical protein AYI68_g4901 [Smittium mucronatum]